MIGFAVAGILATLADVLVALLALAVGGLAAKARATTERLDRLEDNLERERLERERRDK